MMYLVAHGTFLGFVFFLVTAQRVIVISSGVVQIKPTL